MHTLLLIVAIHALILGFGFLIAGWATLLMVESDEQAQIKQDAENARKQGWIAAWRWHRRFRRKFTSPQRLSAQWASRPEARNYIYAGAAFLAVAAVIGIPLGAYK